MKTSLFERRNLGKGCGLPAALLVSLLAAGVGCDPGQPEVVETDEGAFVTLPPSTYLIRHVKQPGGIHIDIGGPSLPPRGAGRAALRQNVERAVRAWLAPMRTFSSGVTQQVKVTICTPDEPEAATEACLEDDSYYDPETRRVIKEKLAKPRIPTRRIVVEPVTDNRSYYDMRTQAIHLSPGVGFEVILHEFGHSFGLGDTYSEGGFFCDIHHGNFAPSSVSVMCNANFNDLQPDDTAGIQHVYCQEFNSDCRRGVLTFEKDIDRPGQDYARIDMGNNSRDCYDTCARDGRCRAFTFVPAGVFGPRAACFLKSAIPGAVKSGGMVSGYKP